MSRPSSELLRARLVALYLVSLAAVYGSILAWTPDPRTRPLLLAWPPFVLGAATLGGAAIFERLSGLTDRHVRARLRSVATIVYGGALFLICMGLLLGHRDAAEGGVRFLQAFQPAFLLLAGFGRGYLGALVNAFVLTASSMLAGGPGAAVSATLHGGFVVFFLAVDHAARQLTEYPVETLPPTGPILRRAALPAALVLLALAVWFALLPASPYERLQRTGAVPTIPADQVAGLIGNLIFILAVSALTIFLVLKLTGGRGGDDAEAPVIAIVQPRRRSQAASGSAFVEAAPSIREWRTKIVKLYVRTAEQLARWGRRRKAFQTPAEFAKTLAPAAPSAELAALFGRARYGDAELTEADFDAATRASREILDHHRKKA